MSTYRNTRRDAAIADDYLANHLPCARCNSHTEREILANLGGRCHACYEAFLAEANPSWYRGGKLTAEQRRNCAARAKAACSAINSPDANPKAWAYRLRDREARGESLTGAQRESWRAVLPPLPVDEGRAECSPD